MDQRHACFLIQLSFFACTINLKRRFAAKGGKVPHTHDWADKMLRDARTAAMTGRSAA
jgi:hypothetical protein